MKKSILAAAGLAVVLAAPSFADEGFYITGGVGYGWTPDMDVESSAGFGNRSVLPSLSGEIQGEGDARFMLGAGYETANNWRVQVDVMDRFNDTGAVGNGLFASDLQNVALMVSGIRDFDFGSFVAPYAGLGLGYSQTDASIQFFDGSDAQGDGNGIAFQGLLGLTLDLSDRISADAGYRYFYGPEVDFISSTGNVGSIDNYQSHDLLVGLRFSFGAAPAPVAPPPVERTPAPAPTCSDVPFVVYFEFDQSTLTDQARQVIARASQQAAECDITRVEIEGHTDRSGSQAYNARLSERRARVVRDELIRLGVAASLISIEARGESEPAVATPDGAREPLNRRTEVVIRTR